MNRCNIRVSSCLFLLFVFVIGCGVAAEKQDSGISPRPVVQDLDIQIPEKSGDLNADLD